MNASINRIVEQTIARHLLFRGVARLGVAVSGGADSMALLHLLVPICQSQKITLIVLHLDHGIRPDSPHDAALVRDTAAHYALTFDSRTLTLTSAPGQSLEMIAHDARHAFFRDMATRHTLDAIATGHHGDDITETLLLRLTRGAGAAGLAGIRPQTTYHGLRLIRPLIYLSDDALREFMTAHAYPWREDSTNTDTAIPRNALRHIVIPALEAALGGTFSDNLAQSADILREEDIVLDALAQRAILSIRTADNALDIAMLLREPLAIRRRVIRQWLFDHALPENTGFATVERILDACTRETTLTLSPTTHLQITARYATLCHATPLISVPDPVIFTVTDATQRITFGNATLTLTPAIGRITPEPMRCSIARDAILGHTLVIRTRHAGDRIAPTGVAGSKSLSDIFTDKKLPTTVREALPIIATHNDEILWVPTYRIATRCAVMTPQTPSFTLELTTPVVPAT